MIRKCIAVVSALSLLAVVCQAQSVGPVATQLAKRINEATSTNSNPVALLQATNLTVTGTATISNATFSGTVSGAGLATVNGSATVTNLTANTGTIGTSVILTQVVSFIKTGNVPFAVSIDTTTNSAGAAIKVLKLTP